ncbi:Hypothetical protein GLP15_1925 [Giardia lamblia P15]|uniref:Pre-mRNA-processing factor 19 n=1 Tax=Giardia intestinalis (strain P15) TaxID=658858 RepID=E1F626_GIAIA|nr:Hypothetical protein GLP15_1925 [Giardia lamblia P15]
MTDLQSFYHSSVQPKGGDIVVATLGNSGSTFAVATAKRVVSVYTLGQSEPTITFKDFNSDATSILFSYDESLLALGTMGGSVHIYDLRTKSCYWKFSAHKSYITAMAFTHSGMFLATGSIDGSIHIWDTSKRGKLQDIASCNSQPIVPPTGIKGSARLTSVVTDPAITALTFPSSGAFLFIGDAAGRIFIWNTVSLAFIQELMAISRSGNEDLSLTNSHINQNGNQLLQVTKVSIKHITAHDEHKIIAVCDGEKVTYWDVGSFSEITRENRAGGCDWSYFMNNSDVSLVFHSHGMLCVDYEAEQEHVLSSVPVNLDNLFSVAIRRSSRLPQVVMLLLEQSVAPSVSIWVINLKHVEPFKTLYAPLMIDKATEGSKLMKKSSDTTSTASIQQPKPAEKRQKPPQSISATPASSFNGRNRPHEKDDKRSAEPKRASSSTIPELDIVTQPTIYSVFDPNKIQRKPGDTDEMLSVLLGNAEIIGSMEHKSIIVEVFSDLWQEGNIKAAIETLLQEKDMRVVCDVLKKIDARNGISISDILPVLIHFSASIEHAITSKDPSITAIYNATDSMSLSVNYAKIFSQVVFSTIQAYSRTSANANDVALEDRYDNCIKFFESMCTIKGLCEDASVQSTSSKIKASAKASAATLRDLRFTK